jgi:uncharacterized protein YprB with RNaseH-like and TPR domain
VLEESIRQRIESLRLILLRQSAGSGAGRRSAVPLAIEDLKDSAEIVDSGGRYLRIDKDVAGYVSRDGLCAAARRLLGNGSEAPGFVFLDLETTGFSSTPLFLAGVLHPAATGVRVVQLLARDYSEERALICALDRILERFDFCITFNGKSFDIPYLRERAKYHRVRLKASHEQFDLLHHARRMWKHCLPNCRLVTLEWHILGRRRIGDVPGWEVPCIYHEFVHTKDAGKLHDVLRHNLIDVVSMAELFINLAEARTC